ncbi:MAG: hypothetical protein ACR2PE_05180 [Porticoccus sp.]
MSDKAEIDQLVHKVAIKACKSTARPYGAPEGRQRLTAKQTAFVSNVAKGMSVIDAYINSYDCSPNTSRRNISVSANKLSKTPKIVREINSIRKTEQALNIHNHAETRKLVIEELFKHAMESDNENIKVKSLHLLGKATGLFVDIIEQTTTISTDRLKSELEQSLDQLKH